MTTETQTATPSQKNTQKDKNVLLNARRKKKAEGRKKRTQKLRSDRTVAKAYHEGKSKRSTEKKAAFRKKKSRKK